jgi:hypothetical protein
MISYGNPEPNNVSEQFICRLRYKTEQAELKAIKKRVLGKRIKAKEHTVPATRFGIRLERCTCVRD